MKTWMRSALRDSRGATALTFAMIFPVIAIAAGSAIDMNRVASYRTQMQAALDAAVLAGFDRTTTPDPARAATFFANRTNSPEVTVGKPTFLTGANRLTGTVAFTYKTSFLALASIKTVTVNVSSTASAYREPGITSITATINSAKGTYDKQIYFFTKDKVSMIASQIPLLDYNYDSGNKYYSPPQGSSLTVAIPAYESYGYFMTVYGDGSDKGQRINPKTLWSTDPDANKFRHTTGTCSDAAGQTDSWEDGGSSDYMDFVVTLKCTIGPNGPLKVRLVQ